jgi:hypothetical protein
MSKSSKNTKSSKNNQKKPQSKPRKTRGTWLTIALIVIVLHGLAAAVYYAASKVDSAYMDRPWLISLMVVHFLANVLAAVGIWYWKKWGVYIYIGSTILAVIVGLITTGLGMVSIFYFALPLVIVGWLLRTKWDYFET